MASSRDDQRRLLKSFAKANNTGAEVYRMMVEAYGNKSMSKAMAYAFFKEFKDGREDIKSRAGFNTWVGVRTPDNMEAVRNMVEENRRVQIKEIAEKLDISVGSIHKILHNDLKFSKRAARWVPCLLSEEHRRKQVEMAKDFIMRSNRDGQAFWDSLVTMDEYGVH